MRRLSMVLTDWSDGVLRWVIRLAIIAVPVVLILGSGAVVGLASVWILGLGLQTIERVGRAARPPLSFCLPGFRESLRRRYFGGATMTGLGVSLFVLGLGLWSHRRGSWGTDGNLTYACLQVIGGFLVGMAIGLIVGTPRLILSRLAWNVLMLLSIPLLLAAAAVFPILVEYPIIGIPVCAGMCVFVWLQLGEKAILKRGHRMIIEDALEQRAESGGTRTAPGWVDSLFRERMDHRQYLKAGRYVWGGLYEAFGSLFSYWKWILLAVVITSLVLGLVGNEMGGVAAVICFGFAVRLIRLPVASPVLRPGGRRERYYATFVTALAAAVLLIGAAAAVVVLCRVSAVFLGANLFRGGDHPPDHQSMGLIVLLLPCLLVPAALGIQLMQQEGRGVTWIPWTLSFASVTLLWFWRSTWPEYLRLWFVIAMFVFGWVFFLLTLRAACRRWDLG
jgi:hypothetical protein